MEVRRQAAVQLVLFLDAGLGLVTQLLHQLLGLDQLFMGNNEVYGHSNEYHKRNHSRCHTF